ncbi:tRNA (adenosine(37)-N6)-threonylcarbamoyltransferase complex ATPase subunit type 1 TsaE [Methylovirgula sp. 4M-Z18]|uniref:tRNA (adenosine(37)-N6)-threonylcarbamoyltransferase complex ATPase subunit type 1 TsaE n=1 Tax=Methylovirgula sp. 4M-Z18 TaxID=2293567 RepID=UPI000E2F510A|nr:tRNA (adenosine(37)-N6)-threonylcarbamoyltransferase complex ATPase subunit type 1 TsaE [Methylovirgula sp. 4M-Z18]RFB79019.1 tRNA (adenosine(37)-N6)-threonylcarbamoyltransferase complex ATPase subunit type 1 TsaE [Methylovirgula sp. 4M-Z18]
MTFQSSTQQSIWRIDLPNEPATEALAFEVAQLVGADDLITLSGDLGAGKTTFARALIRHLTGERSLEVPSPTFTLMQVYDGREFPVVHADLYRIKDPEELGDLGWEEASDGALIMVEWPERAGSALTADRLNISFFLDPAKGTGYRHVVLTGVGKFAASVARAKATDALLGSSGWAEAQRIFMLGDASTRAYERLRKPKGDQAVLMISPPRPDGPPVRFGRPYSAIAKLAENIRPFIAVDLGLRELGYSAPAIYAQDMEGGLAILEDLGDAFVTGPDGPVPERYSEAIALLADLHAKSLPETLTLPDGESYRIPIYDIDAMLIEVELICDWYAPYIAGASLTSSARATFVALWRDLLSEILVAPATWVLRDYHSPNLLWLADRKGFQRVGLIDFQDCVLGHPAYDVVSLLQDARVDVPAALEMRLLGEYVRARRAAQKDFDTTSFARAYAIMGAQRATKILGIFARLDKRDNKPQYLAHIPRLERYLAKCLAHEALEPVRAWCQDNLPRAIAAEVQ